MEALSVPQTRTGALSLRRIADPGALCGWLLAVVLTVYLGVRQGGFDTVIGSQVAIAAWWLLLMLFAFGLVRAHLRRSAWVGFGLLVGYAAWTTLSLTWTESSEATMVDVSQMLLYVALMGLVLLVRGREAVRWMLSGLAVGIVAVCVIALLSRLHYQWFPVPAVDVSLASATKRLSYPLDYWNALAALMAVGFPALLYCATGARTLLARAAAAGCLPLLALCAFLTASRGGVVEIAVGLVLFIALAPDRLSKLAVVLAAGIGSGLLIGAADQRGAVREGLRTALAAHQGNELIAIAIAVGVGVGLLVAAIVLVERHVPRPAPLVLSRRQMTRLVGAGGLIAIIAFIAAGGIGLLHRKWDQFKTPGDVATSSANAFTRLQSSSGEGRYQFWQVAAHAASGKPLTGTGANTFQFVWLQRGAPAGIFVVDAHSLYLQALGDLGYPGLLLIVAFIASILGCGVWRIVRTRDAPTRLALAAATAGAFAFAFSAAIDWVWFIPVLPFALFVCAGVIFAPDRSDEESVPRTPRAGGVTRVALRAAGALLCLGAIVAIALPMAATEQVRASNAQVRSGNLAAALSDAKEAVALQPYAAAGWLQEALVQEQAGNVPVALADAQQARKRQAVNWQIWIVLSRLELRAGNAKAALADERHAHWLNPNNFPAS
jgi:hypothetical protein